MSRHAKFNSGRSGKTSGISPTDRKTVAPSRSTIAPEHRSRKVDEFHFKEYCKELIASNFSHLSKKEMIDVTKQKEVLEELFTQVSANKGFQLKSARRATLFLGMAMVMLAGFAGESVAGEIMKDFQVSSVVGVAGGALIGGAVGGPVGAVAGAGLMMIPAAEAKPVVASKSPAAKPKTVKKDEMILGFPLREMVIPKERVYAATADGGDWVITWGQMKQMNEFYADSFFDSNLLDLPVVPIKNADLVKLAQEDDYEGFKKLFISGMESLQKDFDKAQSVFKFSFVFCKRLIKGAGEVKAEKQLVQAIAHALDIDANLVESAIKKTFRETGKSLKSLGEEEDVEFYSALKSNMRDLIFSHFDEEFYRRMFEDVKMVTQEDGASYPKAQALCQTLQIKALKGELYTDRAEKARMFALRNDTKIVFVAPGVGIAARGTIHGAIMPANRGDVLGLFATQFIMSVKDNPIGENAVTYTHETLHAFDTAICQIDEAGRYNNLFFISAKKQLYKWPCGDDLTIDYKYGQRLINAFHEDYAAAKAVMNGRPGRLRPGQARDVVNTMDVVGNSFPHEIITTITDIAKPKDFMTYIPNVAVARCELILKSSPEARLYEAILRCDKSAAERMVVEDPSLMEKKYDGMTLIEVVRTVADLDYDKLILPELKKGGKENPHSYKELCDTMQEKYSQYQKSGKPASSMQAVVGVRADGSTKTDREL